MLIPKFFRVLRILLATGGFVLFLFFVSGSIDYRVKAQSVTITASIPSVCGNNIIDSGEQCDGTNLNGQSCASRGYSGGTLSCGASCAFDTSQCTTPSPPSSGGGGGGGGGVLTTATIVNFSGRAYPKSLVTLLKDAQVAAAVPAGADANFQISLSGISGGNYIFSIYSEDKEGRRSSLLTFPISVIAGATTNVSGIFIAPTIAVDKSEVKRGDNISIFGQSFPLSEITVSISSEQEFFDKVKTDKDGVYLYNFDTEQLDLGQHLAKSKSAIDGQISSFSRAISFLVGLKNVLALNQQKCPTRADLNSDCRVNLVDFSIAAYWYKRPISAEFAVLEKNKLNGDGKLDLVDFSIMAYYWTG